MKRSFRTVHDDDREQAKGGVPGPAFIVLPYDVVTTPAHGRGMKIKYYFAVGAGSRVTCRFLQARKMKLEQRAPM